MTARQAKVRSRARVTSCRVCSSLFRLMCRSRSWRKPSVERQSHTWTGASEKSAGGNITPTQPAVILANQKPAKEAQLHTFDHTKSVLVHCQRASLGSPPTEVRTAPPVGFSLCSNPASAPYSSRTRYETTLMIKPENLYQVNNLTEEQAEYR